MIGRRDGGDGMYTTKVQKADRMAITMVKMEMGLFLHKLEPQGTMLGFSFMFIQA